MPPLDTSLQTIKDRLKHYRLEQRHTHLPESAVLIPLDFSGDETHIYFAKRSEHLNKHPGQIAFPGGKREEADSTLEITALRETEEEINLSRNDVTVLAELNALRTRYNLRVIPFVGVVNNTKDIAPDMSEIDEVFAVSITELLNPKNRTHHKIKYAGGKFAFPAIKVQGKTIWGLTYFILADFLNIVYKEQLNHKKQKLPTKMKPALLNGLYKLASRYRK